MTALYVTGVSPDGRPLIGGIFRMKDEIGFPLDMSFEICQEHNWRIDYLELLCDAWLKDCLGFDSVIKELDMLESSHVEEWKTVCTSTLNRFPKMLRTENPISTACKYWLSRKRKDSIKPPPVQEPSGR